MKVKGIKMNENSYITIGKPCWFHNTNEMPVFGILQKIRIFKDGTVSFYSEEANDENGWYPAYNYCTPFIGKLPFGVKEKLKRLDERNTSMDT